MILSKRGRTVMPAAVKVREDCSAEELRRLAARSRDANMSLRLLSLAAVRDGMRRESAARIGGMDRQTLRDWVHRFNDHGPDGLRDNWSKGPSCRALRGAVCRTVWHCGGRPRPGPGWCRALAAR